MSDKEKIIVKCHNCGHTQEFEIYKTVNTDTDPEMKEKVRKKDNFKMICEKCGTVVNADHSFVYHDPQASILINYIREADVDKVKENMVKGFPGYICRTVNYQNDLVEKLMIFDAGLDDRIIEIIKAVFVNEFYKVNPNAQIEEILFENTGDKKNIIFVNKGMQIAATPLADEVYRTIEKQFEDKMPPLRRDSDTAIDFEWAMNLIQESEG